MAVPYDGSVTVGPSSLCLWATAGYCHSRTTGVVGSPFLSHGYTPMGGGPTADILPPEQHTFSKQYMQTMRKQTSIYGSGLSGSCAAPFASPNRRLCTIWWISAFPFDRWLRSWGGNLTRIRRLWRTPSTWIVILEVVRSRRLRCRRFCMMLCTAFPFHSGHFRRSNLYRMDSPQRRIAVHPDLCRIRPRPSVFT